MGKSCLIDGRLYQVHLFGGALSVTVTEIVNVRLNMNVAITENCQMHGLREVFRKYKSHVIEISHEIKNKL